MNKRTCSFKLTPSAELPNYLERQYTLVGDFEAQRENLRQVAVSLMALRGLKGKELMKDVKERIEDVLVFELEAINNMAYELHNRWNEVRECRSWVAVEALLAELIEDLADVEQDLNDEQQDAEETNMNKEQNEALKAELVEYMVQQNAELGEGYELTAASDGLYVTLRGMRVMPVTGGSNEVRLARLIHSSYVVTCEKETVMTCSEVCEALNKLAPSEGVEQVCITFYGLDGAWFWLDAEEVAREGLKGFLELHLNEVTAERILERDWLYSDWEGDLVSHFVNTYGFDMEDYVKVLDSGLDAEVIAAGLDCGIELENIEDAYCGHWESDEDYAQSLAEDCGDIPEHLWNYIDWERYARDICMDMTSSNGHYFRNF
ncbi:antirestriction protein ArdA [Vibrio alginolyticus]|nr:antirestriction protein ArdA [Vibrio alginolyticus]